MSEPKGGSFLFIALAARYLSSIMDGIRRRHGSKPEAGADRTTCLNLRAYCVQLSRRTGEARIMGSICLQILTAWCVSQGIVLCNISAISEVGIHARLSQPSKTTVLRRLSKKEGSSHRPCFALVHVPAPRSQRNVNHNVRRSGSGLYQRHLLF